MHNTQKIFILLPAYNEADNLQPLLEQLRQLFESEKLKLSIIIVNDGSTDKTNEVIEKFMFPTLPIVLLQHPNNLGLARAIETGLQSALRLSSDNDVIVTMDADNSHPPELIPALVEKINQGYDVVIASRFVTGGAEHGVPFSRRVLSRWLAYLLKIAYPIKEVSDYASGFRAYRASLLRTAASRYGTSFIESQGGFTITAEILIKLRPLSTRITEIPLILRYDLKLGASKIKLLPTIARYLYLILHGWRVYR